MPSPDAAWTLTVARSDLSQTRRLSGPVPELGPGEALLRVERVGLTANNVTYAVLGEAFRYWEFFPTETGRGVVPLWGFAEVVDSRVDGLEHRRPGVRLPAVGQPPLVRPGRVDERGFRDDEPTHRATLPSPYNAYALTTGDPAYEPGREDLQVLFRPLFWTSFMLADWLDGQRRHGRRADRAVVRVQQDRLRRGVRAAPAGPRGRRPHVAAQRRRSPRASAATTRC